MCQHLFYFEMKRINIIWSWCIYYYEFERNEIKTSFYQWNDPGTAGVWRIAALNEAGGWKDRTTVEDMDLAVRASLKGWKFLYLGSVKVYIHQWFNLTILKRN
jgi:hypothetical protein